MTYARREWTEERNAWRSVIFLNLVRNINEILHDMSREMSASSFPPPSDQSPDDSSEESHTAPRSPKSLPKLVFKEKHRVLQLRLGPLRRIQTELEQRLGAASKEPSFTNVTNAAPFEETETTTGRRVLQEFSVNSTNGWKSALDKFRSIRPKTDGPPGSLRRLKSKDDETAEVIAGCRDDMKAIWEDSVVRELLSRRKTRIEESAGL